MGVYGYSYTSFLITAFVCCFPIQALQWSFIAYSAVASTGFLLTTLWRGLGGASDAHNQIDPKKRLIVIGFKNSISAIFICSVQVAFLLIFKLYFFKNVNYVAPPTL